MSVSSTATNATWGESPILCIRVDEARWKVVVVVRERERERDTEREREREREREKEMLGGVLGGEGTPNEALTKSKELWFRRFNRISTVVSHLD
jgi:hypothetical protein